MASQATALAPGAEVWAPAVALGCLQPTEPRVDVSKDVRNEERAEPAINPQPLALPNKKGPSRPHGSFG